MKTNITTMPFYLWILLAIILLSQSIMLFRAASKSGANRWFWAIWGLMQFPCPAIFYLLIVRKVWKREK